MVPSVPGLVVRPFRGPSDYPGMVAVFNASQAADRIEWVTSVDELSRRYASLTGTDLSKDVMLVEIGGTVAGYCRVERRVDRNEDCTYVHVEYLVKEWRGQGIERAMLEWSEHRAQELAVCDAGEGARFVASIATDRAPEREALLREHGYVAVSHDFVMVRSLLDAIPDLDLPAGIEVRPVQKQHLRAIWEAEVEAFGGVGAVSDSEDDAFERWLDEPNFQPERWQVAWEGREVAGMIRNFVNAHENAALGRKRGYTENISVRPAWRRRGLARALLARSLHLHRSWGMTEAALGVNSANQTGALDLYESVGFCITLRQTLYRKLLVTAARM